MSEVEVQFSTLHLWWFHLTLAMCADTYYPKLPCYSVLGRAILYYEHEDKKSAATLVLFAKY